MRGRAHRPVRRGSARAARRAAPWPRRSRPRRARPRQGGARARRSAARRARGVRRPDDRRCASRVAPRRAIDGAGLEDARGRARRARRCGARRRAASRAASGACSDWSSESGFSIATTRRRAWSAASRSRSSRRGLGEAPADDLVQAATDERVLGARGARAGRASDCPAAPRRAGSVAGSRSRPSMRATSSIRSISRVTSSRRSGGTVASQAVLGRRLGVEVERVQDLALARARHSHAEDRRARARSRRRIARRRRRPRRRRRSCRAARVAPQSSIIRRVASACACMHCSGARPFSKREEASLRSPSAHEVRWMFGPFQVATSSSTRVVSRLHLRARAAHQAGDRGGPSASSITTISAVERARLPVERLHLLALGARGAPSGARRRRGRGRRRAAAGR